MDSKKYRLAWVHIIQAIKLALEYHNQLLLESLLVALRHLRAVTPPHDGYALRNVLSDMSLRIPYRPLDDEWASSYEVCRDMLGMLDVPYAER